MDWAVEHHKHNHSCCYEHSNPCNAQVKERTTDTYERGKGTVEDTAEEARRAAWDAVERTEAAAAAATERAKSATGQVPQSDTAHAQIEPSKGSHQLHVPWHGQLRAVRGHARHGSVYSPYDALTYC